MNPKNKELIKQQLSKNTKECVTPKTFKKYCSEHTTPHETFFTLWVENIYSEDGITGLLVTSVSEECVYGVVDTDINTLIDKKTLDGLLLLPIQINEKITKNNALVTQLSEQGIMVRLVDLILSESDERGLFNFSLSMLFHDSNTSQQVCSLISQR